MIISLILLFLSQEILKKEISGNHEISVICPQTITDSLEFTISFSAVTDSEYIENIDIVLFIDEERKEKLSITRKNYQMNNNFKKDLKINLESEQVENMSNILIKFTSRDKYGQIAKTSCTAQFISS